MPWLWITSIAIIVTLVLADLYGWHRGRVRPSRRSEFITSGLYVILAFVAAAFIHEGYEGNWLGMQDDHGTTLLSGREAATQFLTLTLWQIALDLDGVFIVAALFAHLKTPQEVRHRVLLWGVVPALAMRTGLLMGGWYVLEAWPLTRFLLSGLLLLAALRMIVLRQENYDEGRNWILRFLRRFVRVSPEFQGNNLTTRVGGRLALTPLLVAVVLLETADLWVAVDSAPALLAISREPYLLFMSTAMSLLCLRSIYIALEGLRGWLRFVKIGLACVLAYAAVLMALPERLHPSTIESLVLLVACVGAGSIFALRPGSPSAQSEVSPLGEDADRAAKQALRRARQAIMLVVGITLLILGLIMIPLPGPGIIVIFVALAVLGNEFAWARELTAKYRRKAMHAAEASAAAARRRFRPWILAPVMLATTVGFFSLLRLNIPLTGVLLALVPSLIGQAVWGYMAFFRIPRTARDAHAHPPLRKPREPR